VSTLSSERFDQRLDGRRPDLREDVLESVPFPGVVRIEPGHEVRHGLLVVLDEQAARRPSQGLELERRR
jgi:hypothetical protein